MCYCPVIIGLEEFDLSHIHHGYPHPSGALDVKEIDILGTESDRDLEPGGPGGTADRRGAPTVKRIAGQVYVDG